MKKTDKLFLTLPEILERAFAKHVQKSATGCWKWAGPKSKSGYGKVMVTISAHRLAYLLEHGNIPDGAVLDHQCDHPECCNPAHLKPVSSRENILRGTGLAAHNIRKTQCPQGHPYSTENTAYSDRRRYCKECKRIKALARYYRLRGAA